MPLEYILVVKENSYCDEKEKYTSILILEG